MNAFIRPKTLFALAVVAMVTTAALLAEPAWWIARGVRDPAKPADDYAILNQGQLKNLARAARDEMNEKLPGGAGSAINDLAASWSTQDGDAPNYATVNLGQIKALAFRFYSRMAEFNLPHQIPWTATTEDDDSHALANLGQAKAAFDWIIPGDSDGDGINDAWEWKFWNGLDHDMRLDSDGDGIADGDEIAAGSDPLRFRSGSGTSSGLLVAVRVFNPLR